MDLVHNIRYHQTGISPKSSEPTYLQYSTVHCTTGHYITLQYITLQYITLYYSTLHYITVHYITYMHRTWCTESYVTRGAQVLSHQNVYIYKYTLQYSTIHYITIHNTSKHFLYKQKEEIKKKTIKNEKHKALYLHFCLIALNVCT